MAHDDYDTIHSRYTKHEYAAAKQELPERLKEAPAQTKTTGTKERKTALEAERKEEETKGLIKKRKNLTLK